MKKLINVVDSRQATEKKAMAKSGNGARPDIQKWIESGFAFVRQLTLSTSNMWNKTNMRTATLKQFQMAIILRGQTIFGYHYFHTMTLKT